MAANCGHEREDSVWRIHSMQKSNAGFGAGYMHCRRLKVHLQSFNLRNCEKFLRLCRIGLMNTQCVKDHENAYIVLKLGRTHNMKTTCEY
jgi:hypothetical protein